MPQHSVAALDQSPSERVHWVRESLRLTETIGLTGFIPRLTSYEDTGGPFYLDPEGVRPDLIEDDLALWIETDGGTVVCLGCAHAGLVNTLRRIQDLTGGARFRAIVGGFHLVSAGPARLRQTVAALKTLKPDMLIPCHCTGDPAVAFLKHALGDRVSPGAAGMIYHF